MSDETEHPDPSADLRRRAEESLEGQPAATGELSLQEMRRLAHELQVHQIELQMQNDQLRATEVELATSLDRYRALYDQAPTGYVTVGAQGVIRQANLTFAGMLGVARGSLIGCPLSSVISPDDQDTVYLHLRNAREDQPSLSCELRMLRADGSNLWVQLTTRASRDLVSGMPEFRVVVSDISARVQAEEALRALANQWRDSFNSLGDAVAVLDPEGRIVRANRAMAELTGMAPEEMIGRHCFEIVHHTSDPIAACPLVRMQRSLRRESLILPLGDRVVEAVVDPILDESGRLTGAVHVLSDITERVRAEEALRESERVSGAIVRAIPDMLARFDRNGTYLDLLPAADWEPVLPPNEIVGRNVTALFPREQAQRSLARIRRATETGLLQVEEYALDVGGETRHYESRMVPCGEDEALSIVRDITERVRAEQALRLRDAAIDASTQGIAITDSNQPDNPAIYVNQGFTALTGYAADEVLGHNMRLLQGPDTDRAALEEMRRAIQDPRGFAAEVLNYRKDGTPFWNYLTFTPVRDASGRLTHFVSVSTDVTALKEAEEAQRAQAEQLRGLNAQLAAVQETERTRLARDLHDQVGQNMAALGINLALARSHVSRANAQGAQTYLQECQSLASDIGAIVRGVMDDLRPPMMDDFGLYASLRWQAAELGRQTGLAIELVGDTLNPRLTILCLPAA